MEQLFVRQDTANKETKKNLIVRLMRATRFYLSGEALEASDCWLADNYLHSPEDWRRGGAEVLTQGEQTAPQLSPNPTFHCIYILTQRV